MFALAVALVSGRPGPEQSPAQRSPQPRVATAAALALMVPSGFAYLSTGLVAPSPYVFGAYAFGLLLGGAVWLAHRRSWLIVAVPIVSAGIWPLMVLAGETYLNWSPQPRGRLWRTDHRVRRYSAPTGVTRMLLRSVHGQGIGVRGGHGRTGRGVRPTSGAGDRGARCHR